jgi:glycosyltransferase involved in cell wall biosynthesis
MKTLRVLMVHAPTTGLHNDAVVLGDALRRIAGDVEIDSLDIPWNPALDYEKPANVPPEVAARAPFDIAFHFEHLYGHAPLRATEFARRRIFVPNIEWLMRQDELEVRARPPDGILYKNRFTRNSCEALAGFAGIRVRAITGWTSRDLPRSAPLRQKDFRSFLHVRGVSVQKNAEVLLEAWHANPHFPQLTLITSPKDDFHSSPSVRQAHNIEIIARELSAAELRRHQQNHGIHAYPSYAEGFGHALNEARICGSVLVTTGAPPMSELVNAGNSGFLIPVDPQDIVPLERASRFQVRVEALASTVRQVLATPVARLAEFGQRAREQYVRDALSFHSRMHEVLRAAGIRCDDESADVDPGIAKGAADGYCLTPVAG